MCPRPSRPPLAWPPAGARRQGKTGPLVPALALLMVGGTLYGLWELTGGLGPPADAPVTRSTTEPEQPTDVGQTGRPEENERRSATRTTTRNGTTPGAGDTADRSPTSGPELRRQFASVARGFRTATPDLRALNELVRDLAEGSSLLAPSVEHGENGTIRGSVGLGGTDLEARFEIHEDAHRIVFVESSFDTVHPPFLRLELEIRFDTPGRKLSGARARLAFVPNPERRALDHIGAGEELRVGWDVRFGAEGATARGIGAWVAADLDGWRVGPSEKARSDKRVRDLSSFEAWRRTLAGAR